jgi:hypothetical protein
VSISCKPSRRKDAPNPERLVARRLWDSWHVWRSGCDGCGKKNQSHEIGDGVTLLDLLSLHLRTVTTRGITRVVRGRSTNA